ncbi:DUF7940 domain-containing protein [Sphingopyxis sp. 550A]
MKYLIDNAGQWWRMWSVRLAALAGVVAAYLAANPDQTQSLLDVLPDGPLRVLASIGIGVFVFGLATGTRLMRQPEKGNGDV